MKNYKGIYYNDNKDCKYFECGAHFRYKDLFHVLLMMGGNLNNENEREKESEIYQNKLKNEINDLENFLYKEQKIKTRNIAQLNFNNNPNTMNSFNNPVAFKSYNSLSKNNIKQSRNVNIGECFRLDNNSNNNAKNYSSSKKIYNKTTNNGFNDNNKYLYNHGRYLSNNMNLNNNYLDNNEKNDSININININNNYLNYLNNRNNRNKNELDSNKYIVSNIINKKINAQNEYIKNININNMCAKLKKNQNYVASFDKNNYVNNNVNNNVNNILKPNNNNSFKEKPMNFPKTNKINYTKSPALKKNFKLFNGKYIKTTTNNNNNSNERKKINNCFSFIGLEIRNKTKRNNNYNNYNNLNIQKNYDEIIALQRDIKNKINQIYVFKTNNNNINFNGNFEYTKKGASRNLDGAKRIHSSGLKIRTVSDFLNKKHEI